MIALGVLLAWFPTRLIIWFSALIGIGVISINTRLSLLNALRPCTTSSSGYVSASTYTIRCFCRVSSSKVGSGRWAVVGDAICPFFIQAFINLKEQHSSFSDFLDVITTCFALHPSATRATDEPKVGCVISEVGFYCCPPSVRGYGLFSKGLPVVVFPTSAT